MKTLSLLLLLLLFVVIVVMRTMLSFALTLALSPRQRLESSCLNQKHSLQA